MRIFKALRLLIVNNQNFLTMEEQQGQNGGGILDVLSGNKPVQTEVAFTTNWKTVVMVVVGVGLAVLVMRYLKK